MQAGETGFTPELLRQLTTQAADAADHAYAPYSKFRVGAALLLQNGAAGDRAPMWRTRLTV